MDVSVPVEAARSWENLRISTLSAKMHCTAAHASMDTVARSAFTYEQHVVGGCWNVMLADC